MAAKKKTSASEQTEMDPRFAPVVEAFIHKRDVTYGEIDVVLRAQNEGKVLRHVRSRQVRDQAAEAAG